MTFLLTLLAAFLHAAPVEVRRAPAVETIPALPRAEISLAAPAANAAPAAAELSAEPAMEARGAKAGRSARAGRSASARRSAAAAAAGGAGGDGEGPEDGSADAGSKLDFDGAGLRDRVKDAVVSGGLRGVTSLKADPGGVTLGLEPEAPREEIRALLSARLGDDAARVSLVVEGPRLSARTFEQRRAEAEADPAPKGPAEIVSGALPVQLLEESLWRKLGRMKVDADARAKLGRDARPYFQIRLKGSKRDARRVMSLMTDPRYGFPFYGPVPVQLRFKEVPEKRVPARRRRRRSHLR